MQENILVSDNAIAGTLKYLSEGTLVDAFGTGNFMALKFGVPEDATSCLVGMDPSEGSGLVEIINDPDKNGAFKVANKDTQKFKVVTTVGGNTSTVEYDLKNLTVLSE